MLPVNQFILSGSDPLFNSGNLNEQIQYLEEQKRIIDARQKQIQQNDRSKCSKTKAARLYC